jgi:hypothetical protein
MLALAPAMGLLLIVPIGVVRFQAPKDRALQGGYWTARAVVE